MSATPRLLLERAVAAGMFPGAAAGWRRPGTMPAGELYLGAAALRPSRRPVTPATRFDLASLTKPLSTTAIALLAARDGRLGLDAPLGDHLPGCGRVGRATIRHLLAHTAGLPDWVPLASLAGGDPGRARDVLLGVPLQDPPGSVVRYSCVGFLLLGMALERCFGCGLDRTFATEVADPLGIGGEVGFAPDPAAVAVASGAASTSAEARLARTRGCPDYPAPPPAPGRPDDGNARLLGGVAGNSGLFATLRAVLRLASIWMPGGQVLDDRERAEAIAVQTPPGQPARGLGWQLARSPGSSAGPALSPGAFGHTGFTGTSLWLDPERGAVLVLLGNRNHPDHRPVDLHPLRRRFHVLALAA